MLGTLVTPFVTVVTPVTVASVPTTDIPIRAFAPVTPCTTVRVPAPRLLPAAPRYSPFGPIVAAAMTYLTCFSLIHSYPAAAVV